MTAQELLSAFDYPGYKWKVLSLLPVLRNPAGIRDSTNWTLLHYAARRGWIDVCRLLVEQYQVDPHVRNSGGGTALHWASIYKHLDTVQYLVRSVCCDPLTVDKWGRTPLSYSSGEITLFLQGIIG